MAKTTPIANAVTSFALPSYGFGMQQAAPIVRTTGFVVAKTTPENDPSTGDAWIEFLLDGESGKAQAQQLLADAGSEVRNRKTRFCIWASKACDNALWWTTPTGKKLIVQYGAQFKLRHNAKHAGKTTIPQCPDSQERTRLRDAAITYFNRVESTQAKADGRDAVLVMTSAQAKAAELGPLRVAREALGRVYLQLSSNEDAPADVQKLLEGLKTLVTPKVIAVLEAPRIKAATEKALKAAVKAEK